MKEEKSKFGQREWSLARILLVDDDPASRLTLQTILRAGGYSVDAAASAAEGISKLEAEEYELVLSDLEMESPGAGRKLLAHARMMPYEPAVAWITIHHDSAARRLARRAPETVLIEPENVPALLDKVADLISSRATRRIDRELRLAAAASQIAAATR